MIQLNDGNKMPMQGIGTLLIKDPALCEKCIYNAIRLGVRMIDTAPSYFNEEAVGNGIQAAITDGFVKREELFIVTKLWIQDTRPDRVRWAVMQSLKKLQLEYINLFLIHQPYRTYLKAWPILEEMVKEGFIKSIGVSNFSEEKLQELLAVSEIPPAVNQIEIHPYFMNKELTEYMQKERIVPMAWGSLGEGMRNIFDHPLLVKIGEKYNKTAAQVILRWHMERGIPALFKTINTDHLLEDISIYDFELLIEDIDSIESLDMGYSEIIDYNNPQTEKWLTGWNIYEKDDKEAVKKWKKERLAMA